MRAINRLSAKGAETAGLGKFPDGGGLWLYKRKDGTASWFLRITIHGRRREMGLGAYPTVSVKEAREMADKWRGVVRQGIDPLKERDRQHREARRNLHVLSDVAIDAFESRKSDLKGEGKAGRWFSPLQLHILPKLGQVPIAEIDQIDIRNTLRPIWNTKVDSAKKAANRLAIVFRHAAALGLDVDLQAVDKAKELLGAQRHIVKNIPSVHWRDIPAFYESLSDGSVTHLALRLLILTGVRSAPLRNLRVEQIDRDVWIIPADAMKGRVGKTNDFRVPLSGEALGVIRQVMAHEREGYLFPSVRRGVISDATMSRFMERRGMSERPHGFRSSLRTWLAECTDAPHEVAETCLAHVSGNSVQRAYQRSDFLAQRQILMERWAEHCAGRAGSLVSLHG